MPTPPKGRKVRAPLALSEEVGTDTTRGVSYYDAARIEAVCSSYKIKPAADTDELKRTLEKLAWFFVNTAAIEPERPLPSDNLRRFRNAHRKIKASILILDQMDRDPYLTQGLRAAARRIAVDDQSLPDFPEAELVSYESIPPSNPRKRWVWAIDRQLQKARDELEWIARVILLAEQTAVQEVRPRGKQRDELLFEFISDIRRIYSETAADPREPTRNESGVHGEFIQLLQACLRPLGVIRTDLALFRLITRGR